MVLPNIEMNPPKVYICVPHPEPSSPLPPHTIPLGRPSAPVYYFLTMPEAKTLLKFLIN